MCACGVNLAPQTTGILFEDCNVCSVQCRASLVHGMLLVYCV